MLYESKYLNNYISTITYLQICICSRCAFMIFWNNLWQIKLHSQKTLCWWKKRLEKTQKYALNKNYEEGCSRDTTIDKGSTKQHWIEQVFSYKTLFFHIVTTTGYTFSVTRGSDRLFKKCDCHENFCLRRPFFIAAIRVDDRMRRFSFNILTDVCWTWFVNCITAVTAEMHYLPPSFIWSLYNSECQWVQFGLSASSNSTVHVCFRLIDNRS